MRSVLELHRAERADTLVDALAQVLAVPPEDPFVPDVVAVPEKGIERWLAQRLAHRLGAAGGRGDGVCANVAFPAPAAVLGDVVAAVTGTDPDTDPWAPARSVWPLLAVIDEVLASGDARFAGLAAHLAGSGHGRRYAMARKLTGLFASYATHRPALLRGWAGSDAGVPADLAWQAELWRRLRERIGVPGPAERLDDAVAALRSGEAAAGLPSRLSLFGPTRLAAEHLAVLEALAQHRDVHLWLPHPSPAMWDAVRGGSPGVAIPRADDDSDRRVAHPLLRSLGRDVRELALRLPAGARDTHHPAGRTEPRTLLERLQADLREDRAPGDERPLLDPDDRSVALHACHGPDRQVEVLREVLLGLLARDPTLEPRDIIVMCPDIEVFAPLITASFGLAPDDADGLSAEDLHPGHRLRVRLADRALRQSNPLLGTVATLLELADARLTTSQVLDLVASGPVRRRFRLDDDALERVGELVTAAGVRWGLDGEHRRPFKLENFAQNTWSAGLDRMLLGVAMAEMPGAPTWLGTALPLDEVDSSDVELVGRLAEILDRLGTAVAALTGPQPLTAWVDALSDALASLTSTTLSDAWQQNQARAELNEVVASAGPQAGTVELDLSDVRGLLADRLRGRPSRANFRTGTLTVATLVPMRAVPHRVVCLLGCDDGVFPRAGSADGDDVLARDPAVGERDPRSEDRQLLLDAVSSATEHLVVVSSGADERSGARRPPAVPVGELLDTIDATARTADGRRASEHLRVAHPLQPFDGRNFAAGALTPREPFSFDRVSLRGARAAAGERDTTPRRFLDSALPDTVAGTEVELEDLATFVEHPVRGFLRQRVRVVPTAENAEPADALPVEVDGLQTWRIGDRLLTDRLAGADAGRSTQAEWRRGELPPGGIGARVLEKIVSDVDPLVAASAALHSGDPTSRDVSAAAGGVLVVGTVPRLHGTTVLRVEYSRLKAKQRLRAWVQLLALTAGHPEVAWQAVTLGRGGGGGAARSTLGPVEPERARALLADLVALRREGLREPLPLPTDAAAAYARARRAGANPENARAAAERDWSPFEVADPSHEMVWGAGAPLSDLLASAPGSNGEPHRFGELAMRLWVPLLDAEKMDMP